jgi:hypothetical protein
MPAGDSLIICPVCGKKLPSQKMDDHLFEEHGTSG